jgi:hypothetical protein
MKNHTRLLITATLALLLSGCITSLHPLYTTDTLAFRRELPGSWQQVDDDDRWRFEPTEDRKAYRLTYSSHQLFSGEETQEEYLVHLVRLGDYYFLDFYPEPDENRNQQFSLVQPVLTHTFARLDFEGGRLRIRLFDIEWLEQLFRQRKIRLQHEVLEDGAIVLTAPSEELQKFVVKYAEEEQAYTDPVILERRAE